MGLAIVLGLIIAQAIGLVLWAEADNRRRGIGGKWGMPQ